LAEPPEPRLIEVEIDAECSRALHVAFWRRVSAPSSTFPPAATVSTRTF
jgi:hypothetical protein